ncbi:hypothetical protein GGR56DRAFT_480870 [Xylariaceae sp. FL0804]|nr:hypothetical protein GGR56DRAFT_480870 [Xylariaceae sp. FL0804]
MPATLVIAYPAGAKFDYDYYMTKHMPMAVDVFEKGGLTGWRVIKEQPGTGSPYAAMALLDFPTVEAIGATMKGAGEALKSVQEDLKNYSDKPATTWIMTEVGSGK